ncbi:unnamed protein product [Camellia sinensis]
MISPPPNPSPPTPSNSHSSTETHFNPPPKPSPPTPSASPPSTAAKPPASPSSPAPPPAPANTLSISASAPLPSASSSSPTPAATSSGSPAPHAATALTAHPTQLSWLATPPHSLPTTVSTQRVNSFPTRNTSLATTVASTAHVASSTPTLMGLSPLASSPPKRRRLTPAPARKSGRPGSISVALSGSPARVFRVPASMGPKESWAWVMGPSRCRPNWAAGSATSSRTV